MRSDYVKALKSKTGGDDAPNYRGSFIRILSIFSVGAITSIILTTAYSSYSVDTSDDLVPNMVASVALHQQMSVLALWDDVQAHVGRQYPEFSASDKVRAMQFIAKKMTLPPQRKAVPGEYLLFNHKQ